MAVVRRLHQITASLAGVAALAMVGSSVFGDFRPLLGDRANGAPAKALEPKTTTDSAVSRFVSEPTLAYQLPSGEHVFAWQLQPKLAANARARDVLVMVDTSASQAGLELERTRSIVAALSQELSGDDRLDIWTVNYDHPSATRSLTNGFQAPKSPAVLSAMAKLTELEYGAGAVDLPAALNQVIKQFPGRSSRNQVVLYLGDGESAASPEPISEKTRAALGRRLADREIAFFSVPMGMVINSRNLHGLASMTGGTVVRIPKNLSLARTRTDMVVKLTEAFDTPVLRPDRITFTPVGAELFPASLPPLRANTPTLVLGKTKDAIQQVSAVIEGHVNGVRSTVTVTNPVPAPSTENYFLAGMLTQWQSAPAKDVPAMLASDRTLALASEQFRLYRDEFLTQGVWAISVERFDHAGMLFDAAASIDPNSLDVKAGQKLLANVKNGKLDRAKVIAGLGSGLKISTLVQDLGQATPKLPAGDPTPTPLPTPKPAPQAGNAASPAEIDLLAQAKAAQEIQEQQTRVYVDEALRQARRLLRSDPDSAYEDLKRSLESIQTNDQISESVRRRLSQDIRSAMRDVSQKGAEIKRQLASQRDRIAEARQRLNEFEKQETSELATRARIAEFGRLMKQARFDLAQTEAQVMLQERISSGLVLPPEAHASYRIGQSASNLREQRELRRIREDRYLLTMMQVDKSFIPYPDEPPVHFPPAAVWRELTASRVEKYSSSSFGPEVPPSFRRLRSLLEGETDRRVNLRSVDGLTLDQVIAQLQEEFRDYGVRFVFRNDLFPADAAETPGSKKVKAPDSLAGLALGAYLDIILRDIGMSWVARPEYIEIGPLLDLRYNDKVTRVFDVAELAIGIPNSVNPQSVFANLQFLGQQATMFGSSFVPQFGFGGGFRGGFGGGGFGGGGFGGGGFQGGFQGGMGGMGMGGMGMQGGGMGMQGGQQGVGMGGVISNLSGNQFGIQGNDQTDTLIQLITSVVAPFEWDLAQVYGSQNGQPLFDDTQLGNIPSEVEQTKKNTLSFYSPTRSLIVRGSHRYHTSPSFKLKGGADLAFGKGGPGLPGKVPVAINDPKARAEALAKAAKNDPRKLWNEVFEKSVTDPDLVIDAVDILFHYKEYDHAAESLKASLRKGRTKGTWAHEALTIALQASKANPAEVERAALSSIDLDPTESKAYLAAAQIESDLGHFDSALAFCKRAANLEPNSPTAYANALVYAERSDAVQSDVVHWATANLLHRDWPLDDVNYHAQAKTRAERLVKKLSAAGQEDDAAKLQTMIRGEANRDLIVELLYVGDGDLDLVVTEPNGSTCSSTHKRTTGGGVMQADVLEQQNDRSEIYTAASAFNGTYTIDVKSISGRVVGNKATLKVTKFSGTDHQHVQLYTVNVAEPETVSFTLEGASRIELATVPVEMNEARLATTQAAPATDVLGGSGFGGVNRINDDAKAAMPIVAPTIETKVPGIVDGLGLRIETKVSADRSRYVMQANPIFTGPAKKVEMPKISILPGADN